MIDTWPLWRRILFRFFFIYFTLTILPWWLSIIPGIAFPAEQYTTALGWLAMKMNDWIYHLPRHPIPVQNNGSGDTSGNWATTFTVLLIAVSGAVIWSFLQRRKKEYSVLNYWLCLNVRYFIVMVSFVYGIIKLFGMQMSFPTYSQLATPLGDFLPMRFSWLFIGYSAPYQFFSGLMEVVAGVLLLYRRTITLGAIVAAGVFLNIAVLNLSYDIPVKIFSIEMVVSCLFLLANEKDRILCFFVYNRPAPSCSLYNHFPVRQRWHRVSRIVLKTAFILLSAGGVVYQSYTWQKESGAGRNNMPFEPGIYDVITYAVNTDTLPPLFTDSIRWQNVVFDNSSYGSIATSDTIFRRRYGRGYFSYKADTLKQTVDIFRNSGDSIALARLRYQLLDKNTITFQGIHRKDSIFFVLRKNPHYYQLTEKQFHWISEANR